MLCLSGGKQGNFQLVVELPAHDHPLDLRDHHVHRQKHLGAFHQMAAVGVAVPVTQADVHMQVRVPLIVVADDAGGTGELRCSVSP